VGLISCTTKEIVSLCQHDHPKFGSWATSSGVNDPTWYLEPVADKVVDIDFGL